MVTRKSTLELIFSAQRTTAAEKCSIQFCGRSKVPVIAKGQCQNWGSVHAVTPLTPNKRTCAQARNAEIYLFGCLISIAAGSWCASPHASPTISFLFSSLLPFKDCHCHGKSLGARKHVLGGKSEVIRAARRHNLGVLSLFRDLIRKGRVAHSLFAVLLNHVGDSI